MPIKPYAARHSLDDWGDSLKITIPSKKQWFQILFMGFWLIGWAFGEITVGGIILTGKGYGGMGIFLLAWFGGWTIGGGYALYIFLWQLFGREKIQVSNIGISIDRSLLGSFPKEYSSEHIQAVRISPFGTVNEGSGWSKTLSNYGLNGGLISFDYGAKTIGFGAGIDEAEAKQILVEIQKRYPRYRSKENSD